MRKPLAGRGLRDCPIATSGHIAPLRAGCGTFSRLGGTGCRAVTGPVPSRTLDADNRIPRAGRPVKAQIFPRPHAPRKSKPSPRPAAGAPKRTGRCQNVRVRTKTYRLVRDRTGSYEAVRNRTSTFRSNCRPQQVLVICASRKDVFLQPYRKRPSLPIFSFQIAGGRRRRRRRFQFPIPKRRAKRPPPLRAVVPFSRAKR